MKRRLLPVFAALFVFPVPAGAATFDCGHHAHETRRQASPGKLSLYCRCNPGFTLTSGTCNAIEITRNTLEHLTGEAFRFGVDMRRYAEARLNGLPKAPYISFLVALYKAETGDFDGATKLVSRLIDGTAANDPLIRKLLPLLAGLAAEQELKPHQDLPDLSPEIALLEEDLAIDSFRALPIYRQKIHQIDRLLIEAGLLRDTGDLASALAALEKAAALDAELREVALARTVSDPHMDLSRALPTEMIEDAALQVRTLARRQEEKGLSSAQLEARVDRLRQTRQAVAAWDLANEAGSTLPQGVARALDREAVNLLLQLDPSGAAVEKKMMDDNASLLIEPDPSSFCCTFLDGSSSTNLLLQSLEYGNGDWERGRRFLETVHQVFPKDPVVGEALDRLLSFQSSGEDTGRDE